MSADQTFKGFPAVDGNFTMTPNMAFELMPDVTGAEFKCLFYIIRHTYGFHDKAKHITIPEFVSGRKRKDGSAIDNGTGLSRKSVIDALQSLTEAGYICRVIEGDKAREKHIYSLRMQEDEGCKNYTPEVQKLHPGGVEITPRSKKETLDKKLEKSIADAEASAGSAPATAKKERPRNPYFDAIVTAFKFDAATLTKTEASGIGKVAAELKAAAYAPEDVAAIYAYLKVQGFTTFTPQALTKHAAAWRATGQQARQQIEAPRAADIHEPTPEERAEVARMMREAREGKRVSA